MLQEFQTIAEPSEGLYKEKGSKFLAFAYPASSEEDVSTCLEALRSRYHDARHHCYAYQFNDEHQRYRANDDGEPNHSAGDPILGQIRSRNLYNVLVVVVRYFGGTKLGVSGLIVAYKTAAAEALDRARVVTEVLRQQLTVAFGYEQTGDVHRIIHEYDGAIREQQFDTACRLRISFRRDQVTEIQEKLDQLVGVKVLDA
ncbi:uncharacterized protein, YigZ family [Catalinimonas alkaloidigena]|uniref:Uncharacterized protein, YigZ family n=1 Tax=Catalinimonas alkaloidigena TaxID=1075417 RepID=A0A1G8XYJ8_9BACT|nr:YigZ family protein [Catalinimonas alkaloidigena]SDJ95611.1 uncharacterized protein, YigZ family [Catalinimonas alkaloidigena]